MLLLRPQRAYYTDDFNRANAASASSVDHPWTDDRRAPKIDTNAVQCNSTTTGHAAAMFASPTITENQFVEAIVKTPVGTNGSSTTHVYVVLHYPATSPFTTATKMVGVFKGGTGTTPGIYTAAGDMDVDANYTKRSGNGGNNIVSGDRCSLENNGNLYTMRVNGTSVATFTDSGNLVPRSNRGWGMQFQAASSSYGFAMDSIIGRDL